MTNTIRVPHMRGNALYGAEVLKAFKHFLASKDMQRKALEYVGVKDGFLYATDGHKALRVSVERLACGPIPEGVYSIGKGGKDGLLSLVEDSDLQAFPNVEAVIPKKWALQFEHTTGGKFSLGALLFKLALCGYTFQHENLDALPEASWTVCLQPENVGKAGLSPVLFVSEHFLAVVMPTRGDVHKGTFKPEAVDGKRESLTVGAPVPLPEDAHKA